MDSLPLIVKILLALPGLDGIVYGIYRICRGDLANAILGIIWIPIGAAIGWILDIFMILTQGKVFELKK
jgi:hypothetical protein